MILPVHMILGKYSTYIKGNPKLEQHNALGHWSGGPTEDCRPQIAGSACQELGKAEQQSGVIKLVKFKVNK